MDLRDRIAATQRRVLARSALISDVDLPDYLAQAIIDDLRLAVGQRIYEQGWPDKPPVHQIVGRWES